MTARVRGHPPRVRGAVLPGRGAGPREGTIPAGAGSREQGAGSREQGAGSREQGGPRSAALPEGGISPRGAGSSTAATPRGSRAGDGPRCVAWSYISSGCSPHPRGWSQGPHPADPVDGLLPAPAGMAPTAPPSASPVRQPSTAQLRTAPAPAARSTRRRKRCSAPPPTTTGSSDRWADLEHEWGRSRCPATPGTAPLDDPAAVAPPPCRRGRPRAGRRLSGRPGPRRAAPGRAGPAW